MLRVRVPDPAPLWPEIALFLLPGEDTVLHQSPQARAPPGHGKGPVRGRAEAEEKAREEGGQRSRAREEEEDAAATATRGLSMSLTLDQGWSRRWALQGLPTCPPPGMAGSYGPRGRREWTAPQQPGGARARRETPLARGRCLWAVRGGGGVGP